MHRLGLGGVQAHGELGAPRALVYRDVIDAKLRARRWSDDPDHHYAHAVYGAKSVVLPWVVFERDLGAYHSFVFSDDRDAFPMSRVGLVDPSTD